MQPTIDISAINMTPTPEFAGIALENMAGFLRHQFIWSRYCCEGGNGNRTKGPDGHYPQWDGGKDRHGRNHKAVWPELAQAVVRQQLNFKTLVDTLFDQNGPLPEPHQLLNDANLQAYQGSKGQALMAVAIEFEHVMEEIRWKVNLKKESSAADDPLVLRLALYDPEFSNNHLSRFCLAWRCRLIKYVEDEWDNAAIDYLLRPEEYEAVMSTVIPDVFRQAANKIRDMILSMPI